MSTILIWQRLNKVANNKLENNVLNKKKFVAVVGIFMTFQVLADVNDSSVSVDVGSDEQGNKSSAVSVVIAGNNRKEFMFGFGGSQVITGSDPLNHNFAYFGLSKEASDKWKFTGMFEFSGFKDAFTMFSASGPIRFSRDSFYLEAIPAIRTISLTTLNDNKVHVGSSAFGLKAGVFLGNHFRLSGSAFSYSYSHDVSKLASFASSFYFNEKSLILSSGLLEKSYNAEAGVDFNSFSVSLGKNRGVSAIDFTNSDYVYIIFDYYLSQSWTISGLLGKYLDTPENQDNYSSLAVTYAF